MADRTTEEAKREAFYAFRKRHINELTGHPPTALDAWNAALQWQAEQQKGEAPSMPSTWSVEVIADGESLVSIGENWLSGERALEGQDEKTILGAAMHLLSFIGHGLPPSRFDPDEPAASTHGVPPVTDAMVDAYLKANDAYWQRTDQLPTPPNKWRTGTPREATRESLAAALSSLPQAPKPTPFLPGEYEHMTENGRKAWAGVDPQDLRAGGDRQAPQGEQG